MNVKKAYELVILILKPTDTIIEQSKTRPQDNSKIKLPKSMDTFSLNPRLELKEKKFTIGVINLEVFGSVFYKTEHNNRFTIYIPGFWQGSDFFEKN